MPKEELLFQGDIKFKEKVRERIEVILDTTATTLSLNF